MTRPTPDRRTVLKTIATSSVASSFAGCTSTLASDEGTSYTAYLTDQERMAPMDTTELTIVSPEQAASEETLGPFREPIMNHERVLLRELSQGEIKRAIFGRYHAYDVAYSKDELVDVFSGPDSFQESYDGYELINLESETVAVTDGRLIRPRLEYTTRELKDLIDRVNGNREIETARSFDALTGPLSPEFYMTANFRTITGIHLIPFDVEGLTIRGLGQDIQISGDELTVTSTVLAEEEPERMYGALDSYQYDEPYNDVGIVRYASPSVSMNGKTAVIEETRPAADFVRTAAR